MVLSVVFAGCLRRRVAARVRARRERLMAASISALSVRNMVTQILSVHPRSKSVNSCSCFVFAEAVR